MIIVFFISIALSMGYIYLLQWITEGWEATTSHEIKDSTTSVTVIIVARNEEFSIAHCLQSIIDNDYPQELLQIIVVDDHSDDQTMSIVTSRFPDITLLHSSTSTGKKSAIELASREAKGELLLFTDADCIVPTQWIETIVVSYQKRKPLFIAAPIQIKLEDTNISRFQYLDVVATMAVTANGIFRKSYYSANGANMAVNREEFIKLYGIRKDSDIASGDDMFTIQYLAKQDSSRIIFLRSLNAMVTTKGESSFGNLVAQRKRWAGKSRHYPEKNIVLVQSYVFLLVLMIFFNLVFGLMTDGLGVFTAVMMLFIKITMDYLFLSHLCTYYKQEEATKKFLISAASYNVYILLAGFVALFPSKYIWKGRSINS